MARSFDRLIITCALIAFLGCGKTHGVLDCGDGMFERHGDIGICVHEGHSFEDPVCPPEAPILVVGDDGFVCASSEPPVEVCGRIGAICPTDAGTDTTDVGVGADAMADAGHGHTHYYASVEAARVDGLATYLPLSEDEGDVVVDHGLYFPGDELAFDGIWTVPTPSVDNRHGPIVSTRSSLRPRLPTALGAPFTVMAVIAGPNLLPSVEARFHLSIVADDCDSITASITFGDGGVHECAPDRWCTSSTTALCPDASLRVDRPRTIESASGVVYAFFVWDEAQHTVQLGQERAQRTIERTPRVGSGQRIDIGSASTAHLLSFAIWDRVLLPSEMNAIRQTDAELVDGF